MNSPVSAHDELWLRSRFTEPRTVKPVTEGDGHLWQRDREIRPAAVLVPVVKRKHALTVLFTRRTAHLNDHAGQISFPGGRSEPGDADAAETALREAAEEIGLAAAQVEVLGELPEYVTVTGYRVTPVVGLVTPPLELRLDEFEVAVVFGAWFVYAVAYRASPFFALLLNVAALYLTMGFRQRSHFFTDIHLALKEGDVDKARGILSAWRQVSCAGLDREAITRLAIEEALVSSRRYVFAVIFWFVLLPGPAGAILYRLSMFLHDRWSTKTSPELERFSHFARRAFAALDWLPVRFTAAAFAVVGDFEDAVYCWRTQAANWPDPALGIVLASGAGAIGVRLGMPTLR